MKNNFIVKLIYMAVIGLFLWGFILTQSRGGAVALCAMLFILWIRSKKKIVLLVFCSIALAVGWRISPQDYKDRVLSINTAADKDEAAISRLDAWKAGWNMMTHRAFGVGAGNFGEGFPLYRPVGAVDVIGERRVAHNIFIQIGGEAGFPGLIVFVGFIISAFQSLHRIKKNILKQGRATPVDQKTISLLADATFMSLVGYCASGMFLSQAYNFVLCYLVAFSVVLERIANESVEGKEKSVRGKKLRTQDLPTGRQAHDI